MPILVGFVDWGCLLLLKSAWVLLLGGCVCPVTSLRDWLLFVLGINSGLRISDLLLLKVNNVHGQVRVSILEVKTGKKKDFPLSETCVKAIKEYLSETNLPESSPLFPSRKGGQAISRVQAYRIINATTGNRSVA